MLPVGEDHHRAKLTDHDVDLIRQLLADRRRLVLEHRAAGSRPGAVDRKVNSAGLSYALIAAKFEITKSHVRWLAIGGRRVGPA